MDNKLKQRVIQYLTSNRCGKYVDTGVLASDLQRMYSIDYGQRKRNAFRIQVEKDLADLEDEHLAKRARHGEEDNEYAESYSDDSSMEDYPDPQNSKDSSLLESNKKRKGKLNSKGSKKKKDLQEEVCKMLIHMRHPEVYHHLGVIPPRGVLLHGPPGCGKTLLAHAIAGELDLPILKAAATEIVSGVSGESEQKLRELFEQAVSNAPCILFIDEIDAVTPKREIASKDMERRIVAQLLTCMDDLNNVAATTRVLVIGTTNRPDFLDPALRRAGRFDRAICLGIPDEASRERILQTLCRKLRLPETFHFCHLAHLTPGFAAMCAVNRHLKNYHKKWHKTPTGCRSADLSALVREASICALKQEMARQKSGSEKGELKVSQKHFEEAFKKVKSSISKEDRAMYEALQWSLSQVLNSSTGLLSHPLALLTALLPRAHLTLLSRISAAETTCNINNAFGPGTANQHTVCFLNPSENIISEKYAQKSMRRTANYNACSRHFRGGKMDILEAQNRPIISPSNEHPGLISFRMYWFHLLVVQGTLKNGNTRPPDLPLEKPMVIAVMRLKDACSLKEKKGFLKTKTNLS
ncbi:hypothetical protein FD755_013389 [Muntiacus reevesi]|uniref:AAA+ ATPase domain-containing protein n=1 Tax=Muntiacus reevesi TaxID=9886 RepID=A0A5N3XLP5_MUNRE|nr:hypothetical protein FD755_013389 [Muntiacus reevesi]